MYDMNAIQPADRKYALTKVASGDYLLPSNDRQTIWRITRYVEGPATGLDMRADRDYWGVWRWRGDDAPTYLDTQNWTGFEFWDGFHETRADAVKAALNAS